MYHGLNYSCAGGCAPDSVVHGRLNGVCGAFTPVRHAADEVSNRQPIVIGWQAATHSHFVPLVQVIRSDAEGSWRRSAVWPLPHQRCRSSGGFFFDEAQLDYHPGRCLA